MSLGFSESALIMLFFAGAAGGAAAGAGKFGARLYGARRERKRDKAHLGLRIAVELEQFSQRCIEAIHECEIFQETSGSIGQRGTRIPVLGPYPDGEAWTSLDADLADRIMTFRNAVGASQLRLRAAICEDAEAAQSIFVEECGVCGADAWALAEKLRRSCGLKPYRPAYDFPSMLSRRAVYARATGEVRENDAPAVLSMPSEALRQAAERKGSNAADETGVEPDAAPAKLVSLS